MDQDKALVVFQDKRIRRMWHDKGWYFSVVDVIAALTDSQNPRNYWSMLKTRESEQGIELSTFCVQLKLLSPDGKHYETDCANTQSLFRLIQSIPSPKAEPFKLWLAQVGYERVQEIEDPELAMKRMREIYKAKGYSEEWVEKRSRGIAIRNELTDEWEKRGVANRIEYAILTAEISKATFGLIPSKYKRLKGLKNQNLRDHMDDLELILTMLGEATTTRMTKERDSMKFPKLRKDAKEGGEVAGSTRKDIENRLGKSIISKHNYLKKPERQKRINGK
jgi:DNA-damage-inducible protein D